MRIGKPSLALALVALLFAGCDTLMVSQYRVSVAVSSGEAKVRVLRLLADVAAQEGLKDSTATSEVEHTLVLYSQPRVRHFRVDLGARTIGDSVVIDLVGGFGSMTDIFAQTRKALIDRLERDFHGHYDVPSPYIPINLPNHAPDPTASAVTPAADAPVAPAIGRGSS